MSIWRPLWRAAQRVARRQRLCLSRCGARAHLAAQRWPEMQAAADALSHRRARPGHRTSCAQPPKGSSPRSCDHWPHTISLVVRCVPCHSNRTGKIYNLTYFALHGAAIRGQSGGRHGWSRLKPRRTPTTVGRRRGEPRSSSGRDPGTQ